MSRQSFWLYLLVIVLLGTALRAYQLNGGSIWIDEIWSVRAANAISTDIDRPTRVLGFLPTKVVLMLSGHNAPEITGKTIHEWRSHGLDLWHIRLGAMVIGAASIPLLVLLVRRVLGSGIAIAFGFLLAVAPWHLYWSQLGRYYTLKFFLIGMAAGLYILATRGDRLRSGCYAWAIVFLFLAYLTHPPALMLAFVFGIDWVYGFIRRNPIRLGVFGWGLGLALGAAVAGIVYYESLAPGRGYGKFVGSAPELGQKGPLIVANTVFMIQLCVVCFAALSAVALWKKTPERRREIVYFSALAVVPVAVMAVLGLKGKFAHSRYTFESLLGALMLAGMGGAYCFQMLRPRVGALLAVSPVLFMVCASMLVNAAYFTTGHHLHKRWVDVYDYLAQQREAEGDEAFHVIGVLPEVGQYYLGDPDIEAIPGTPEGLAEMSGGKPMWVVAFGATAIHNVEWHFATLDEVDLAQSFPLHTWQPYTEVRVYRYTPKPAAEQEAAGRSDLPTDQDGGS